MRDTACCHPWAEHSPPSADDTELVSVASSLYGMAVMQMPTCTVAYVPEAWAVVFAEAGVGDVCTFVG